LDLGDGNLWTASLRREQLLELLEGRGPRPARVNDPQINLHRNRNELLGIWYAAGEAALAPLPQLLVAERPVLDDLYAWSASYLRTLGPLTSIVRTLTPEQFESVRHRDIQPEPWRLAGGAIGLVVGEILCHTEGLGIEGALAAAPSSTLSFAILRAWFLGLPTTAIAEICEGYVRLFERIRGSPPRAWQAAEEVARALIGIDVAGPIGGSGSGRYKRWMKDLGTGTRVYEVAQDALRQSTDLLSSQDALRLEEMTAEGRVQFFDKVAPKLVEPAKGPDRLDNAFALALAAFTCRPGLEQQAGLLREHAALLPEAWLWLGALQSLSPVSASLTLNGGGGWRIIRELFRPEEPWVSPRADAAIGEIDVLLSAKSRVLERLVGRSRMDVAIYPMITTAVRSNITGDPQSAERRDAQVAVDRDQGTAAKIEAVETNLENALRLVRQLRGQETQSRIRTGRRRR
jgi:hypothetical protein